MSSSTSQARRVARTLRATPRFSWIWSKRRRPLKTSRITSSVHRSPSTSRVRAIEQIWSYSRFSTSVIVAHLVASSNSCWYGRFRHETQSGGAEEATDDYVEAEPGRIGAARRGHRGRRSSPTSPTQSALLDRRRTRGTRGDRRLLGTDARAALARDHPRARRQVAGPARVRVAGRRSRRPHLHAADRRRRGAAAADRGAFAHAAGGPRVRACGLRG